MYMCYMKYFYFFIIIHHSTLVYYYVQLWKKTPNLYNNYTHAHTHTNQLLPNHMDRETKILY